MMFKNLLQTIRTKGYVVSNEELQEKVVLIAAPVMNSKGNVIAPVSIAGQTTRINGLTIPKLIKQVQQAADEVTMKLSTRR